MTTDKNAYFAFTLLFLLYMFDYIDRLVVVSLFPFLQQEWNLSDTQCGLLVSAVYWSILLFSFPVSILVDRWSRKKTIGLMSVLWSIATLLCVFTKNFKQLFAARVAIGIGEAGYAPGGTALISALFPAEKRARMLFPALSSVVSAIILFYAFTYLAGKYQYVALLCSGVTLIMFVPPGVAVTQDVVHAGLRATSLSINIVIQHTLGSPLGPLFIGAVSDNYGLASALRVLPFFTLLAGSLFFVGSFFYIRDLDSVEAVDIVMEE